MKKFTLLELLIVIAVIGILLTLLIPSLRKARDRAHTAVCLSNQRQIGVANQLYTTRYDNTLIRAGYSWANILGSEDYLNGPRGNSFDNSTINLDVTYQGNPFFCPSGMTDRISKHAVSGQWNWVNFEETQRPWRSGESAQGYSKEKFPGGFDVWYGVVGTTVRDGGDWAYPTWRENVDTVGWPKMYFIEDPARAAAFHDGTHHQHTHWGDKSRISVRHNGYRFTNMAFYDGHAKSFLRSVIIAGSTRGTPFENPVIFQSARN